MTAFCLRTLKLVVYCIHKLLYTVPSPTAADLIFLRDIQHNLKSGIDDFVLFNSLEGNGALFANVLCNIPILCISLICNRKTNNNMLESLPDRMLFRCVAPTALHFFLKNPNESASFLIISVCSSNFDATFQSR